MTCEGCSGAVERVLGRLKGELASCLSVYVTAWMFIQLEFNINRPFLPEWNRQGRWEGRDRLGHKEGHGHLYPKLGPGLGGHQEDGKGDQVCWDQGGLGARTIKLRLCFIIRVSFTNHYNMYCTVWRFEKHGNFFNDTSVNGSFLLVLCVELINVQCVLVISSYHDSGVNFQGFVEFSWTFLEVLLNFVRTIYTKTMKCSSRSKVSILASWILPALWPLSSRLARQDSPSCLACLELRDQSTHSNPVGR